MDPIYLVRLMKVETLDGDALVDREAATLHGPFTWEGAMAFLAAHRGPEEATDLLRCRARGAAFEALRATRDGRFLTEGEYGRRDRHVRLDLVHLDAGRVDPRRG